MVKMRDGNWRNSFEHRVTNRKKSKCSPQHKIRLRIKANKSKCLPWTRQTNHITVERRQRKRRETDTRDNIVQKKDDGRMRILHKL